MKTSVAVVFVVFSLIVVVSCAKTINIKQLLNPQQHLQQLYEQQRTPVSCGEIIECKETNDSCAYDEDNPNFIPYCVDEETSCVYLDDDGDDFCLPNLPDGSPCDDASYCLSTSECTDGICTFVPLDAGSVCSSNSECSSGTCRNFTCIGAGKGASCIAGDCNSPFYCNRDGVCDYTLPLNAICSPGVEDNQCGILADCVMTSSGDYRCVQYGAVSVGGFCNGNTIVCNKDGAACASTVPGGNTTCVVLKPASNLPCSDVTDCNTFESCTCNYTSGSEQGNCQQGGFVLPAGNMAALQKLLSCATMDCGAMPSELCIFSQCAAQFCNYLTVLYGTYSFGEYPPCLLDSLRQQLFNSFPPICKQFF